MRPGEIVVTVEQVRALVDEQFPEWSDLPLVRQPSNGTDNALFRLGDSLTARLPRAQWAVDQVATDATWLPRLAPYLPVPVPVPVAVGRPGGNYPWPWTVVPWLPGRNPEAGQDLVDLAVDLAGFVRAMIAIDPMGGPVKEGIQRGVPLVQRDELTRRSIAALGDRIDGRAVTAAWDEAMAAGEWPGPPVWLHGDLLAGNLLVNQGRLVGVIDFGGLGRGDPAVEVRPGWSLFDARARAAYREALGFDEATWVRGWAWMLSVSLYWLADLWDSARPYGPGETGRADVKAGDVLHLTRAASPQFARPILFRLIKIRADLHTYSGWTWLDGYQLNERGEAVARRELYVLKAGTNRPHRGPLRRP